MNPTGVCFVYVCVCYILFLMGLLCVCVYGGEGWGGVVASFFFFFLAADLVTLNHRSGH